MATTYQGTCGRVPGVRPGANFKEAVCVDTSRVYDSVSEKDQEEIRRVADVYLTRLEDFKLV